MIAFEYPGQVFRQGLNFRVVVLLGGGGHRFYRWGFFIQHEYANMLLRKRIAYENFAGACKFPHLR